MVSDNTAKVLSSSWGGGGFNNTTDDPIYQEMAAQGQTFLNATGDNGAYNSSTWLAPSADPNVLESAAPISPRPAPVVRGRVKPAGRIRRRLLLGFGFAHAELSELAGVITTTNKGSTTYRNNPDVAMEANFDNPTASNGSFLTGYGGTRSPLRAGRVSLRWSISSRSPTATERWASSIRRSITSA